LWKSAGRLNHVNGGQKLSIGSWKTTLGSQGIYIKMSKVTAQKRVNLLFLRGCKRGEMMMMVLLMRWEPMCHHRTMPKQHWVLKNLFSGLSIYSSPFISTSEVWGGGRKKTVNAMLIDGPSWVSAPSQTSIQWTGFTSITIILWLENTNKSWFLYLLEIQLFLTFYFAGPLCVKSISLFFFFNEKERNFDYYNIFISMD
jgi:hypothetical protein